MVVSRQAYANGCLERDVHAMFEYVLACMHVGTASFCKPQILSKKKQKKFKKGKVPSLFA